MLFAGGSFQIAFDPLSDALNRMISSKKDPALVTRKFYVIYLAPDVHRWGDRKLVGVIAEEVAHTLLHRNLDVGTPSRLEEQAIALTAQWGFRPSGARARLRKMREQEKQLFGTAPD